MHSFHYTIKYGTIFGSKSFHSGKIFTLKKKIIRIMAVAQPRTSCRSLFKQLESPCSMPLYTRCDNLIPGIVAAYHWGVELVKLVYSSMFGHVSTCINMSHRPNESFVPKQQRK